MNLLHLQYFYVVAKENGFTKASKVLRIQQPAISRMVRMLEDDLGFKLFEKVGRHVQLTKQGQEVFEHCRRIFGSVENLQQELGQISAECKGPLHVAAAEPIASEFFPSVLREYSAKFPKVYPNIFSGPASMMFQQILAGSIELGVFFHIPDLDEKLEIFEKRDTRFHLVIRKDLRRRKETLETFIGSREIDDTSTRRFPTLERLRRDHPEAKIRISSNNLSAHRRMVHEGLGVSILPEFLVGSDIRKGLLADIYPGEKFVFQMKFIKRRTTVLAPAASEFVRTCLVMNLR